MRLRWVLREIAHEGLLKARSLQSLKAAEPVGLNLRNLAEGSLEDDFPFPWLLLGFTCYIFAQVVV